MAKALGMHNASIHNKQVKHTLDTNIDILEVLVACEILSESSYGLLFLSNFIINSMIEVIS